jgi:WD40 repeat protein
MSKVQCPTSNTKTLDRQMLSMSLRAAITIAVALCAAVVTTFPQTPPTAHVVVQLKATLSGHTKGILELAFSPDGELVATGSEDGTVRIWNAHTGELNATLICAPKYLWRLNIVWSPDGRAIAIDGQGNDVRPQIWDARSWKLKANLYTHDTRKIIWSLDSKRLLTTRFGDKVAKLWDGETGRQLAEFVQDSPCPKRSFFKAWINQEFCGGYSYVTADFDAAGQSVITASDQYPAKLWDAQTGKLKTVLPLRDDDFAEKTYHSDVVMSPDHRLVARYLNNNVALLDTSTGEVKRELGQIGLPMAFSPDSQMLLITIRHPTYSTAGDWDEFKLYDVATGQLQVSFEKAPLLTFREDFYWVGHTILLGRGDGNLLDARTGKLKGNIPYDACVSDSLIGDGHCQSFILSADGSLATKMTNPIRLWNTDNAGLLTTLTKEQAHAPALFSPTDSRLLITRAKDKRTALLWEVAMN